MYSLFAVLLPPAPALLPSLNLHPANLCCPFMRATLVNGPYIFLKGAFLGPWKKQVASQPGRGMTWVILEPSTWCFFELGSLKFEICSVAFWGAFRGAALNFRLWVSSLMLASPTWFFGHWALNSELCGCKEDSDSGFSAFSIQNECKAAKLQIRTKLIEKRPTSELPFGLLLIYSIGLLRLLLLVRLMASGCHGFLQVVFIICSYRPPKCFWESGISGN